MGTDIHAVAQAKINGEWVDIESKFDDCRSYKLFAHLAGVRNGHGFAGCDTGDAVKPIQEYRGLPEDFTTDNDHHDSHGGKWMGEHSYGWVSASEVVNHDWSQGASRGIISVEKYKEWDGNEPDEYCGGISGYGISVAEIPSYIQDKTTHVRVTWKNKKERFDNFINEVKDMVNSYGPDVRIVFGFDS